MKKTILAMLDRAAATWPSSPYAHRKTDEGFKASSFSEVREAARAFAAWLLSSGFAPGDRMAILGEGSPEWLEGEYGAMYAGLVSVALSTKLNPGEVGFRLGHSGSGLLLTTHNHLEKSLAALASGGFTTPLIYLGEDIGWARARAAEAGIGEERLIAFSAALAEGRKILADASGAAARLDSVSSSVGEDWLATISYTSGTSGNPKGVMLSHLNLWTNSHDVKLQFDTPKFKTLLILPADHSFVHTAAIIAALWTGVSLYFLDNRSGGIATLRNIPLNIQECQPHFFFTVPALAVNFRKRILAGVEEKGPLVEKLFGAGIEAARTWMGDGWSSPPPGKRLAAFLPYFLAKTLLFGTIRRKAFGSSIVFCVNGGSRLDPDQEKFFAALGLPLLPGYGLTEAGPIVSSNILGCHKFGTVGRPMPSVGCRILDEGGRELPAGETGEICVSGESVMKGYYRNPEATAAALKDGSLLTGDIGFIDEDGFLTVLGRRHALLISDSGNKYSPETIEEAVMMSTGFVEHVMAWCLYKKHPCALVALDIAKTKALIAERHITSAEVLCGLLREEFYRFRDSRTARPVEASWVPISFQIIGGQLGDGDGTINSTLKLVRHRVEAEYRELIDYSYTNEGSRTVNPRNIATLKRLFGL